MHDIIFESVQKGVENDMFWEELKTGGPYIGIIKLPYHKNLCCKSNLTILILTSKLALL
jgi:hypothetical protein